MKTNVLCRLIILISILANSKAGFCQWQWAKSVQSGVNNQNFSACVKTDAQGNIYYHGQSFNYAKIETDSFFFGNGSGSFITKYNTSGVYQFTITAPKKASTFQRFALAGDVIYFGVAFKDTVHKPNAQFDVYKGSTGIALYAYSSLNGNYIGVTVTALTKNNFSLPMITQLETDPSGNLILFGNGYIDNASQDTMFFGSKFKFGSNKGVSGTFSFLAKMSLPSHEVLWLKTASNISIGTKVNDIYRNTMAVDAAGNIVLGFNQSFNVNIDPDTAFTRPTAMLYKKNVFIIKFSSAGQLTFMKQYGSNLNSGSSTVDQDFIHALATDAENNIIITGRYGQAFDFGGQTIQPTVVGSSNFYLAKLNAQGDLQWSKQIDSTGDATSGNSITCRGTNIIVGGTHGKAIRVGTSTLIRMGNNDAFLAEFKGDGSFKSAGGCHTGGKEWIYDVATDANGNTFVVGVYQFSSFPNQGLLLLPGNISLPQGAVNGTLFWAKYGQAAPPPPNPPKAPVNLVASANSAFSISLNWTDSATNETAFIIQNSSNGTNWVSIDSVAANITSYTHNALNPNTIYHYRVYAKNNEGMSAFSNVDTALTQDTLPPLTAPNAPSNLTGTALQKKGGTRMQLNWTDNAGNETSFELERSTDGNSFTLIQNLNANTQSFIDTGLNYSTTYYYRIRAVNAAGASSYSNTATTNTLPNAIEEITVPLFSCYPNPNNGSFYLSGLPNMSEPILYEVYSIKGNRIQWGEINRQQPNIQLSTMEEGVYLIKIGNQSQRIVVIP